MYGAVAVLFGSPDWPVFETARIADRRARRRHFESYGVGMLDRECTRLDRARATRRVEPIRGDSATPLGAKWTNVTIGEDVVR